MILTMMVLTTVLFAESKIFNFDGDSADKVPGGFSTALTGKGKPGVWKVVADAAAPTKPNVLAQMDMDTTGYRFPVCVYDEAEYQDVDLCVKFKPVKGEVDQAAGLVWRYRDQNNYYIVRANALENNVVLYKVHDGKRTDLPLKGIGRTYGKNVPVPADKWSTLRVVANQNQFKVFLNETYLFEVEDNTFTGPGKIGLWTKADSYTLFDDLEAKELK